MVDELADMRRSYEPSRLYESDVAADPVIQFRGWLADAVRHRLPEPNAMVLATADAESRPSTRIVLLKEVGASGFVFFTNLGSRKATEMAANSAVSLCFPWFAMERQVVVCGTAAPVGRGEVAAYWVTRPRDSQLGAWASNQSAVIGARKELEARVAELAERFPGDVPLPGKWGGFRVAPSTVEFWQGAPGRLHDRLRYTRTASGEWRIERLAP